MCQDLTELLKNHSTVKTFKYSSSITFLKVVIVSTSKYVTKETIVQSKSAIKPWEGSGGTIYVNTPTEKASVVANLQSQGYNLSGSVAAKEASQAAQLQTATEIMSKAGYNPVGSEKAALVMASTKAEVAQDIISKGASAQMPASFPQDSSAASSNISPLLLIGGAAVLLFAMNR